MRLDLYLKVSRLMSRRTLAQEFCDAGLISVNGAKAKSSKEVKAGDMIEVRRPRRLTRIEVLSLPASKQVAKSDAASLYRIVGEESIDEI